MADLWSDYTDSLINEIDDGLGTKYKMSVRRFLTDPRKYANQEGISITVNNMHEDVDNMIDEILKDYTDEQKVLTDNAMKADSMTKQLSQTLVLQAKQNKLALVTPVLIERDETLDERIYINSVDNGTLALVERLVNTSTFVADLGYMYKTYKIGSWLFGGREKNYILTVYVPPSEVLDIENSKTELDEMFNDAKALLG